MPKRCPSTFWPEARQDLLATGDFVKLLYEAQSILERDALMARLQEQGIDVLSPPRDISRKMTENTVDLAFEGYSAVNDGFKIYVIQEHEARAKELLRYFIREQRMHAYDKGIERDPWDAYYRASIFSMMLPLVMNISALYNLFVALKSGRRPSRPLYFVASTIINALVIWFAISVGVVPILKNFLGIHL
jgi:hypothetical protein